MTDDADEAFGGLDLDLLVEEDSELLHLVLKLRLSNPRKLILMLILYILLNNILKLIMVSIIDLFSQLR